MRRLILAVALIAGALAPTSASASTHHCRSFVEPVTRADVAPLTATHATCWVAHYLSGLEAASWATGGGYGRIISRPIGRFGAEIWRVHVRQVRTPQFEDPYALITLTHGRGVITFGIHG